MIRRRRPIPRSRTFPEISQHWKYSADRSYRIYADGREVCCDETAIGWREYKRRLETMIQRQNFRCRACNRRLSLFQATWHHDPKRKMGGAFRDDRITDAEGNELHAAVHWSCHLQIH